MLDLRAPLARFAFVAMLVMLGLFLFFPVYWLVMSAFKSNAELYRVIPTPFALAPTLEHFRTAVLKGDLPLHLKNSLLSSGASASLNTILAIYAGYSFAKFRYRGRRAIMIAILSAQVFPFGLLLISLYPILNDWALIDTRTGLVLSYIVFALPVSTLNTPFGTPARSASTAMANAEYGVWVAGFTTIVQPAASAGPALRVIIAAGKFHGVMATVTPIGPMQSFRVLEIE